MKFAAAVATVPFFGLPVWLVPFGELTPSVTDDGVLDSLVELIHANSSPFQFKQLTLRDSPSGSYFSDTMCCYGAFHE